jgi:hypothetical protein
MPSPFDPTAVRDIDDVIDALGAIVAEARERGERFGLFAALYRRTTQEVRRALRTGAFHDPAWVERLDVVFAHRYLQAFADFHAGLPTTAAWAHAFERDREPGHLALQHLMLGMAAHILLDLGVATHDTCDGPLAPRRADFFAINRVLGEMLDAVQDDLNAVSPALAWADRAGGRWDERVATATLRRWRSTAWRRAVRLGAVPTEARAGRIERIDQATLRVARGLCAPADSLAGAATGRLLGWVGRGEPDDVPALIDAVTGRDR